MGKAKGRAKRKEARNVVIVAEGFASGIPCPFRGRYLEWVRINDPADKPLAGWTPDIKKAMHFTMEEAWAQWKQERTIVGPNEPDFGGRLLPDGKPNRPLTAITVSFQRVQ